MESNRKTTEEHPDYLFGKLNYVNKLLDQERPQKVPEALGEELDLKVLYLHRDTFHLREILGFYQVCVHYYLAVDNQDKAEESLPEVLRLLRQGQEFLDFWFADMLEQIGGGDF